jgi:hypothetical protein
LPSKISVGSLRTYLADKPDVIQLVRLSNFDVTTVCDKVSDLSHTELLDFDAEHGLVTEIFNLRKKL